MIAAILEQYDLWQSCDLINPSALKRTVIIGKLLLTESIVKIWHCWTTSQVSRCLNF